MRWRSVLKAEEDTPMVPATYDRGDRSEFKYEVSRDWLGRRMVRTSRSRDTSPKGYTWNEIGFQNLADLFNNIPSRYSLSAQSHSYAGAETDRTPECPRMSEFIRTTMAPLKEYKLVRSFSRYHPELTEPKIRAWWLQYSGQVVVMSLEVLLMSGAPRYAGAAVKHVPKEEAGRFWYRLQTEVRMVEMSFSSEKTYRCHRSLLTNHRR